MVDVTVTGSAPLTEHTPTDASIKRTSSMRDDDDTNKTIVIKSKASKRPCVFYLQGGCHRGAECLFSHECGPASKLDPCKFHMTGSCLKGHIIHLHVAAQFRRRCLCVQS